MGNRHGGDKASKEEKKKKKKEKKAKKKSKKKTGPGSDVDLDPESSHFSRADSESMVFHSAENISPYLDASTRSEEGAAYSGFHDSGHVLSSKDFQDGFSIEACLPPDLAAVGQMSEMMKPNDDVTSLASGGYSTPLLSSPDVRRGIPRSPLSQRHKDSFPEPVPPIPSDFSTTPSTASYMEEGSSTGTGMSSSRTSSSTVDTNAAHCIERLEELERNIERTFKEKFFDLEKNTYSCQRGDTMSDEKSSSTINRYPDSEHKEREGSITPKGTGSIENSPVRTRKISETCRLLPREGSTTPKGFIQGAWSQSADNSPVIVRKALPSPGSPVILRRTPSQSPSVLRKFPVNSPESPAVHLREKDKPNSPTYSPVLQPRATTSRQEESPRVMRKVPEISDCSDVTKSPVPPPVPPKPVKSLGTACIARQAQNMPKSPVMPRKVYVFQEHQGKSSSKPFTERDEPLDRNRRENQMPPRSPSRSPETRQRMTVKTPSSSPSPKSLSRKLKPQEDKSPTSHPLSIIPPAQVQFCEQKKGTAVKHCIVSTQPSTAVVLAIAASQECLQSSNGSEVRDQTEVEKSLKQKSSEQAQNASTKISSMAKSSDYGKSEAHQFTDAPKEATAKSTKTEIPADGGDVSEDAIKQSTQTAVFGSVSPKLQRQKNISSSDENRQADSLEAERADSFDHATRSPQDSPQFPRVGLHTPRSNVNIIKYKGSQVVSVPPKTLPKKDQFSPESSADDSSQNDGTISATSGSITHRSPSSIDGARSAGYDPCFSGSLTQTAATVHTQRGSPQLKPIPGVYRGVIEGSTVYSSAAPGITHVSQKTLHLVPAKSAKDNKIPQSKFTAGSTVAKNASGKTGNAGWESFPDTAFSKEREQASGRESDRTLEAATCLYSPPSLPEAASSSTSKVISKNLGERIREVINQSTIQEAFAAELSSSSFERDERTYTSDDSVFTPSGERDQKPPRNLYGNFRSQGETPCVEAHLSDSACSSPQAKRARITANSLEVKSPRRQRDIRSAVSLDSGKNGQRTPHISVLQESASFPPHATAIRRIDVDVNVTLPQAYCHGETVSDDDAASDTSCGRVPLGKQHTSQRVVAEKKAKVMDTNYVDPNPDCPHSLAERESGSDKTRSQPVLTGSTAAVKISAIEGSKTKTEEEETANQKHAAMETTSSGTDTVPVRKENDAPQQVKGDNQSREVHSNASSPQTSHPISSSDFQGASEEVNAGREVEASVEIKKEKDCDPSETERTRWNSATDLQKGENVDEDKQPLKGSACASTVLAARNSEANPSSNITEKEEQRQSSQNERSIKPTDNSSENASATLAVQEKIQSSGNGDNIQEHVPPPSPTAMDALVEYEEGEEEAEHGEEEVVDRLINAHQDSDISSRISEEMKLFGETVVRRLSSLLESHASESDSCLEESKSDLLKMEAKSGKSAADASAGDDEGQPAASEPLCAAPSTETDNVGGVAETDVEVRKRGYCLESEANTVSRSEDTNKEGTEPVLHEELHTLSSAALPGERLVTSDTTETLSTDHETSASSKRESTTSTATDETLTSFKTRSTTDSAEFEETFVLPESLVFVRSVNEEDTYNVDDAVVESGKIVKRPLIPSELTHPSSSEIESHKLRKKRRRQVGSYDVSVRADAQEPVPKRGSKQICEVIDAYCDESSDDSDISSGSTDDVIREGVVPPSIYRRCEHQLTKSTATNGQDAVKRPRPPADRSTDSSDDSEELQGRIIGSSASGREPSRIPEIEDTFGELMVVKTILDDLEDKTPTSESLPVFIGEDDSKSREFWASSHLRRSRVSPTKTDRTESDLDISEQRDDVSTDSIDADDEDEGAEIVYQRHYAEEHGPEVVLPCTIYNSSHDKDDEFWAEAEAAAVEENYKTLETAADAAGSAFQNARIQMHDIHQHLQDLRRQMELLRDDITSTSLTLTPEYSLESEQRPVTE